MRYTFAAVLLILAFATPAAPAAAGSGLPADDCTNCPPPRKYESQEVVKKVHTIDRSRVINTQTVVPVSRRANENDHRVVHEDAVRNAGMIRNRRSPAFDCTNCPPPRKYDSQEVVKKVHTIDRSRVINTQTVVPVSRRVKEITHLVIHENETRNVGVIRHNHTIVEKEIRYVRRVPVTTVVEFVTHNYRVVERPDSITVPVEYRPVRERCRGGYRDRYGSCHTPLRVRG